MKRIYQFIQTVEESLKAVETPAKKREQLEAAKLLAPKILNGMWLTLTIIGINALEATIKD